MDIVVGSAPDEADNHANTDSTGSLRRFTVSPSLMRTETFPKMSAPASHGCVGERLLEIKER